MNGEAREDDILDEKSRQAAARLLDAQAESLDAATLAALTRARHAAGEDARRRRQLWGGAGLGVALAASLTALVVLPRSGIDQGAPAGAGTPAVVASAFANDEFAEVALGDDSDTALADDLAFVAWLEENHDPS